MWQLQEAKNKFSHVVDEAIQSGPQIITRHGVEVAVLLSYQEYKTILNTQKRAKKKLSQFFRQSPWLGVELDLSRYQSDARADIELF